jgi:hypothetical protein
MRLWNVTGILWVPQNLSQGTLSVSFAECSSVGAGRPSIPSHGDGRASVDTNSNNFENLIFTHWLLGTRGHLFFSKTMDTRASETGAVTGRAMRASGRTGGKSRARADERPSDVPAPPGLPYDKTQRRRADLQRKRAARLHEEERELAGAPLPNAGGLEGLPKLKAELSAAEAKCAAALAAHREAGPFPTDGDTDEWFALYSGYLRANNDVQRLKVLVSVFGMPEEDMRIVRRLAPAIAVLLVLTEASGVLVAQMSEEEKAAFELHDGRIGALMIMSRVQSEVGILTDLGITGYERYEHNLDERAGRLYALVCLDDIERLLGRLEPGHQWVKGVAADLSKAVGNFRQFLVALDDRSGAD